MEPYLGLPRLEGQHPDIFPNSPLALVAVFTEIIQERFLPYNELPWVLTKDDPTPEDSEENTEENPRKIYIESKYTQHPNARNFRPAILIDRLDTRFIQIAIGNRAIFDPAKQIDVHICHAQTIISISCLSLSRGESATLAEHVAMYLLANKNVIREYFSIYNISMPVMGSTIPYRNIPNENDGWNTPINLEIEVKYLWRVTPIAPKLQEIKARIMQNPLSLYHKKP